MDSHYSHATVTPSIEPSTLLQERLELRSPSTMDAGDIFCTWLHCDRHVRYQGASNLTTRGYECEVKTELIYIVGNIYVFWIVKDVRGVITVLAVPQTSLDGFLKWSFFIQVRYQATSCHLQLHMAHAAECRGVAVGPG
jgi:hypothetical protein